MEKTASGNDVVYKDEGNFARVQLAAIFLGTLIAFALLGYFFSGAKTNFEDAAALGAETTTGYAKVAGHHIHCMDRRDAADCLAGVKSRNPAASALWLGNSQLHAVNQWKPGQTNSTPILFDRLQKVGLDLVTFSPPNASLQEHYVLFEYLRRRMPLKVLILPVVFDDFRETGLRDEVALLSRDEATASALAETEIGRRLLKQASAISEDGETTTVARSIQEGVEHRLNKWLDEHSALWQARLQIRGEFFVGIYRLRNGVFGIKATNKRKLIPGRYLDNVAALESILATATREHVRVVLYIAPLRGGVEIPYMLNEYAAFKSQMAALSTRFGVTFANLETLVPDNLWGLKGATGMSGEEEIDFMHFQAGGHVLLASQLDELVTSVFDAAGVRR